MREDAKRIIQESIAEVLPDRAVIKALSKRSFNEDVYCIAIGKAAWNMSKAAKEYLGDTLRSGLIITKYDHAKSPIPGFDIVEAGHPYPDEQSIYGAEKALEMVSKLPRGARLLFLLSGGGSALFEKPMEGVMLEEIADITKQLSHRGADIHEINTVRKHLSAVKGGRFAASCEHIRIDAIILSDVLGNQPDAVASGPVCADPTTSAEAMSVIEKYRIHLRESVKDSIRIETPKKVANSEHTQIGSVSHFCTAAAESAARLGYTPFILTTHMDCEAREAGRFIGSIAKSLQDHTLSTPFQLIKKPCAFICGGETLVHVTGQGLGGRNQEAALSAAIAIKEINDVVVFAIGSDGTDGPTDAAGGLVDAGSAERIAASGKSALQYLADNDAYHALQHSNDLVITGATGTNVNDILVLLCK